MSTFRTPYQTFIPLNRTASLKTTYRHLLKTSRLHPDTYVGQHFSARWRKLFENWTTRPFNEEEIESRLERARKELRRLQRAVSGDDLKMFVWSLETAYGVSGKMRHELAKPFLKPEVLGEPLAPIDPSNPNTIAPSYSPFLVSILTSSYPFLRDKPIVAMHLAFPPPLPENAKPENKELTVRKFLAPIREARIRWDYFREITVGKTGRAPHTRFPFTVRVVGASEEGGEERDRLIKEELKALGVDWSFFQNGEREQVLDWLEIKAGKGLKIENQPRSNPPIDTLDLTQPILSFPPPGSSPPPPSPTVKPIASFPENYQRFYRELLTRLPILTIDLSRTTTTAWFRPSLSPYSKGGPYLYRPTSADDEGWLQPPTPSKPPPADVPVRSEEEKERHRAYCRRKDAMSREERAWEEVGQWVERDRRLDVEEKRLVGEWERERTALMDGVKERKTRRERERRVLMEELKGLKGGESKMMEMN